MSLLQTILGVRHVFNEQRRTLREDVRFPAWVDIGDGAAPRSCTVLDVSEEGARISLAVPSELPEKFYLILSRSGTRRRCRLVWRSGEEAGLFYLAPLVRPLPGNMM